MNTSKVVLIFLTVLAAGALTSCNTLLGVSRDLQQGGEAFERTIYGRSTNSTGTVNQ